MSLRQNKRATIERPDAFSFDGWLDGLTRVSRAMGGPRFECELLAALNEVLPIDHCVVFTYSAAAGAGHLFTHGKMPKEEADELARDYIEKYYARDPNFCRIAEGSASEDRLIPLDLAHGYDPAYRNHFFDRHELVDKASTIGRVEEDSVYCNFYRMAGSGPYSAQDWRTLQRILPLVTSLISNHFRIVSLAEARTLDAGASARSVVHTLIGQRLSPFDRLTRRERQVCERILLGYTAVGIGLDLQVAPSSVVTYRRRAYQKLGISSQNDLFKLCLTAARRLRPAVSP